MYYRAEYGGAKQLNINVKLKAASLFRIRTPLSCA
jgi:hypothetical protein